MTTTSQLNDPSIVNSVYNSKNGRYVRGGITEVSSFALEMWDGNSLPPDPSDVSYYVEKKYEGNPRLLGYVFYGDVGLWWVICFYNGIIDPMQEIVEGKLLLIPTMDRVNSLSGTIGGVPTTRSVTN